MHLALRPTPCTTGQVHLLVCYNAEQGTPCISSSTPNILVIAQSHIITITWFIYLQCIHETFAFVLPFLLTNPIHLNRYFAHSLVRLIPPPLAARRFASLFNKMPSPTAIATVVFTVHSLFLNSVM